MAAMEEVGVYCSTSGTYMVSKDELSEHYRSDFHRYNLKRKIAGLAPVTREWYEARKAQLLASSAAPVQRIWFDPLTRKKFYTENTYAAYTRSNKYQDLVKRSGQPAPAAVVTLRVERRQQQPAAAAEPLAKLAEADAKGLFKIKPAERPDGGGGDESDGHEGQGSEWGTDSDQEMEEEREWEEWDVRRCLFDNTMLESLEGNLEYMLRNFGFYLPDAQYLVDPEGLVKYLGAKLQHGHVPLYKSGSNPQAKQFASLHGVQRHMVDTCRCKLLYDGNEEEYEEYYDYAPADAEGEGEGRQGIGGALLVAGGEGAGAGAGAAATYELALPGGGAHGGGGGNGRVLGSREFARYYRQRHRAGDTRSSALAAAVVAAYRRLAVPLLGDGTEAGKMRKAEFKMRRRQARQELNLGMRRNINDNTPKNVPY